MDSTAHDILKENMRLYFCDIDDMDAVCEEYNYDVISYKYNIAVECGNTYGNKLIELFSGMYSELTDFKDFWVLDFYNPKKISLIYKFKKSNELWN